MGLLDRLGSKAPAPPRRAPAGIPRGDFDSVQGWIGVPRAGKSVAMMRSALAAVDTAYILAHDPNHNLPSTLPDGRKVPIVRHDSLDELRRALAKRPRGIHATHGDPSALVKLGIEIGAASLRAGGGACGVPVIVLVDEIVVWDEATKADLGPTLRDLLSRRRHYHVGLWWGTQNPAICHRLLMTMSTDLWLFRMTDRAHLQRMALGGAPEEIVSRLPRLPVCRACVERKPGARHDPAAHTPIHYPR